MSISLVPSPMSKTVPPTLQEPRQPLTQKRASPSCDTLATLSLKTQQPPPYGPPPMPPPPPPNAMILGSSNLKLYCWLPPPPPMSSMHWHTPGTGAQGTLAVQAHRRGGRPPPTRRARPRRNRRQTDTPTPRATTGGPTTKQPRQHDRTTDSPPRAGRARPQPGAQPPRFNSSRPAALATRKIPPLSPTVMRWNIVDRA
jgi:hypothetical protein